MSIFRKNFKPVYALHALLIIFLFSCRKDLGNYKYETINEAVVSGLDSLYEVSEGSTVNIAPSISYTKDPVGDTANYSYKWLLINKIGIPAEVPQSLDSGEVFHVRPALGLGPGVYAMTYRITDKKTGVWKEYPFKLFMSVRTYEGWLLLNETADHQSRLDMLSYKSAKDSYEYIPDVLSAMKSTLKLKGTPNFISFNYMVHADNNYQKVIVGSSGTATYIQSDTFSYQLGNDLKYEFQDGTNPEQPNVQLEAVYGDIFINVNGNTYSTQRQYLGLTQSNILNTSGEVVTIAPTRAVFKDGCFDFDPLNRRFLWTPAGDQFCYILPSSQLNNLDKDLLYLCHSTYNGGENFAILKDQGGDKVYLVRFTLSNVNYFQEITGTFISQARNFAVSNDFGYVFYSVKGQLYEYDFNTGINILMADYGTKEINLLKFQNMTAGIANPLPLGSRYDIISRQLIVCAFDSGNAAGSGIMDLYDVPPLNGQITKKNSFTGLDKVTSLTYRTR